MSKSHDLIVLIASNPGLTGDELAEKTGANKSRMNMMCAYLKKTKQIEGRKTPGERMRYFPRGGAC